MVKKWNLMSSLVSFDYSIGVKVFKIFAKFAAVSYNFSVTHTCIVVLTTSCYIDNYFWQLLWQVLCIPIFCQVSILSCCIQPPWRFEAFLWTTAVYRHSHPSLTLPQQWPSTFMQVLLNVLTPNFAWWDVHNSCIFLDFEP